MGDRTYVTLLVPAELRALVEPLVQGDCPEDTHELVTDDGDFIQFTFSEVNYGNLGCEAELVKHGVPYDKSWDAADEYAAGTQHMRFTEDGQAIELEVYDPERGVSLEYLLEVIDDHEGLKKTILDHQARSVPLPWTNQVKWGKRHFVQQLIAPTS